MIGSRERHCSDDAVQNTWKDESRLARCFTLDETDLFCMEYRESSLMSPRFLFKGSYTCFTFNIAQTCLVINRDAGRRVGSWLVRCLFTLLRSSTYFTGYKLVVVVVVAMRNGYGATETLIATDERSRRISLIARHRCWLGRIFTAADSQRLALADSLEIGIESGWTLRETKAAR